MRICEMINDETWVKLLQLAGELEQSKKKQQPVQPQKKKSQERLSKRELNDLMGVNRSTYYKSGGKIKQR